MAIKRMRSRKAIFFTLMSLLMITLLIVTFQTRDYITLVNRVPVVENRVETANDYVKTLQTRYIERSIYTSGYIALGEYIEYLDNQGEFPSNYNELNTEISELMINGTIGGGPILNENNLNNLLSNITNLADESLKVDTQYSIGNSLIYQSEETGPWRVGMRVGVNFTVNASASVWNVSRNITSMISIVGFNDTYFSLNTKDISPDVDRLIIPTNYTSWNLGRLTTHIDLGTYNYDNKSPNYISRLLNQTNPSNCCGIDSFINQNPGFNKSGELPKDYLNTTFIDYCYFGDAAGHDCDNVFHVTDIENASFPFRINPYLYAKYNISGLDITKLYPD